MLPGSMTKPVAELESGDNVVFNETDIRNWEFVVNGKNRDKNLLLVRPLECILGKCVLEQIVE